MDRQAAIAILFGCATALCWGFSDYFAARATRVVGPLTAAFLVNTLGALTFALIFVLFIRTPEKITWDGFLFASSGGVLVGLGSIAFFRSLAVGPITLVTPISSVYPLVTATITVSFFAVRLSIWQALGTILVVFGVMLATQVFVKHGRTGGGPRIALLAAGCWGAGFSLIAQAVGRIGWAHTTLIELAFVVLTFLVFLSFAEDRKQVFAKLNYRIAGSRFILGAALIQLVGAVFFNVGLTYGPQAGPIVASLSSTYPAITVLLALRYFRERLDPIPFAGALIGIAGVVMLSVGQ
ncbi:EamA family transporter [Catellatospora citrea]|uniref:EamA family transporter n=1 Tax=Catellatospora citrea TaxID=53366 RepID=UPI0033DACC9B